MTTEIKTKEIEFTTYESALAEYKSNPKKSLGKFKFNDNLGNPNVMNITKSEFHTDNEVFLKIVDTVKLFSEDEFYSQYFTFEKVFMSSTVHTGPNSNTLRKHNTISVESNIGLIRFAPHKDGLEITRVIAETTGKGQGKLLMDIFFNILIAALGVDCVNVPIMLECTGSVGVGSNYRESNIASQTKFFRKFGFRVDPKVSNYKNGYVQMRWNPELFVEYAPKMEKFFVQEKTNS